MLAVFSIIALIQTSVGSDESMSTLASESTATGDQTSRARQTLLRKRLRDKDKLLAEKEARILQLSNQLEVKDRVIAERDSAVNDTKLRLTECESQLVSQEKLINELQESLKEVSGGASEQDLTTKSQLQVGLKTFVAIIYQDPVLFIHCVQTS